MTRNARTEPKKGRRDIILSGCCCAIVGVERMAKKGKQGVQEAPVGARDWV